MKKIKLGKNNCYKISALHAVSSKLFGTARSQMSAKNFYALDAEVGSESLDDQMYQILHSAIIEDLD